MGDLKTLRQMTVHLCSMCATIRPRWRSAKSAPGDANTGLAALHEDQAHTAGSGRDFKTTSASLRDLRIAKQETCPAAVPCARQCPPLHLWRKHHELCRCEQVPSRLALGMASIGPYNLMMFQKGLLRDRAKFVANLVLGSYVALIATSYLLGASIPNVEPSLKAALS